MAMKRPCQHPHKRHGRRDLTAVPCDPLGEQVQLVLYSETGPVPYCGANNMRALAAMDDLGERHIAAGTITAYDVVPGDDWADEKYALPQLVLAASLAEAEQRFCVADWAKERIATGGWRI